MKRSHNTMTPTVDALNTEFDVLGQRVAHSVLQSGEVVSFAPMLESLYPHLRISRLPCICCNAGAFDSIQIIDDG